MNAYERVGRARSALGAAVLAHAALWAIGVYALVRAGATLFLPSTAVATVPLVGGAIAAIVVLWRARRVWRRDAVALWLEERAPELRYALVTASESPSTAISTELEDAAASATLAAPVARVLARAFALPAAVLVIALVLPVFTPHGALSSASAPHSGVPLGALGTRAERLHPLAVTVTPPRYTGLATRSLADPSGISAIVASTIEISGPGSDSALYALRGDTALRVQRSGSRWLVRFPMPAKPMALKLSDGSRDRLIVLEPQPDSAPVVSLLAPTRDTVLRAAQGDMPVSADVRDDFGVGDAWVEYIISSGEGESFTFRNGTLSRIDARGARTGALHGVLHLGALALKPGDLIHVRAVAVDLNDASGPDTGASETRTIRIARKGEYDSIAVEGAPPPDPDKSLMSERMLIMRTEALQKRRVAIAHRELADSSVRIARDQARLRKEVSRVIFARLGASAESEESQESDTAPLRTPDQLVAAADSATNAGATALDFEGDETPVVAVNRTLLQAYEAMWEAERRLQVAEPGEALPFMRAALDAIQRARNAERLYLRGRAPDAVVDVGRARLAGKRDDASGASRAPRVALDTSAVRRARRLESALTIYTVHRDAALDSLTLLRVDAIAQDPPFAAALSALIDSVRTRGNIAVVLPRALRAAGVTPVAVPTGAWEGAW